jgi:RNA polymerase sigma-70 factor (ECF subfamily)
VHAFAALPEGPRRATAPLEHPGISDAQLIALAREAKGEALELIYAMHKARIYTFLLRFLGDPEAADDLTQDVFTKAYQALSTLTTEHRVLPWLYRIANNAAIDAIRRRRRFAWLRIGKLAGTADEPHGVDDHSRVPERDHVRQVLVTLPGEQALALLLHALEGYSYKEIAHIQGCSLTAVRSRIARARQAFRERYATKEPASPS